MGKGLGLRERVVLVVEDDPAVRGLVAEILDDAGYTVFQADIGQRGLHLAEQCAPSVVVLNHSLPDMSGLDVLQRLRRRPSTQHIPVLLVSTRVQQLTGAGMGADRVLPMPFEIDALLTHVEELAASSGVAVA